VVIEEVVVVLASDAVTGICPSSVEQGEDSESQDMDTEGLIIVSVNDIGSGGNDLQIDV
jgi:hypothetical protein